jgi:hypothetical protein
VKVLLLVVVLIGCVACGDATTTPLASLPPDDATSTPAAINSPAPVAKTAVTFLNAPLTVARYHFATLQVKTKARASCSIDVVYASGSSAAAGLVTKTSDSTGRVNWTWKVGARTTPVTGRSQSPAAAARRRPLSR